MRVRTHHFPCVAHSLVGIDTNSPAQPQIKFLQPDIQIIETESYETSMYVQHALLLSHFPEPFKFVKLNKLPQTVADALKKFILCY
jgi:hypothetical protein